MVNLALRLWALGYLLRIGLALVAIVVGAYLGGTSDGR